MIATALTIESQIGELLKEGLPGLCETCIHRQGCVYRLRSDKMVLQCELFEGEKTKHQATAPQMGEHKELNVSPHKGLCGNCFNAPHCRLPKAKSGIWHCEEYY